MTAIPMLPVAILKGVINVFVCMASLEMELIVMVRN